MDVLSSLVIGAGQAGLSASYHLQRSGIDHVVLDANPAPGGAWQHRWDSLTMRDVHRVAELPGSTAPTHDERRANRAVPASFDAYERRFRLPVRRPVQVTHVTDEDSLLVVHSEDAVWWARTIVNATGTWSQPFVPHYPGMETFLGEQLHTVDYPGPDHFLGKRVLVVGGGASAVQFLGALAPITDTLWATRREPVWRSDDFTPEAGRAAVSMVEQRVAKGLPPASVVGVTGLSCASRSERRSTSAHTTGGGRCLPRSSRTASGGPTGPSSASTSSCGPPGSVLRSHIWRRCTFAAGLVASSSTTTVAALPRSVTRGCNWSDMGHPQALSAPTEPAGPLPGESPAPLRRQLSRNVADRQHSHIWWIVRFT